MATIPTLIVGPAIVAAGLAYRYGRFDDDRDQRNTWGLTTPGFRARRMSDMTAGEAARYPEPGMRTGRSASISGGGGGRAAGAKFESDFQPQVPSERQRTDSFVPTNMLASSSAASASGNSSGSGSSNGGGWSSQQQQNLQQDMQQPQQPKQSIYDKVSDRRVAETLAERENPFPRTTNELENRSWAFRALHKVSGDLGPIEHKDSPVQKERLVFPEEADANAGVSRGMQSEDGKQGVNVLGSNRLFGNVAPDNNDQLKQSEGWTTAGGLDAPGTRSTTKIEPSENVVGSTVHRASRAADDVNRLGVETVDANQAGLDVTGEGNAKSHGSSSMPSSENGKPEARSGGGGGGGGWFWGSSNKDNNARDAAKKAASESRGWFWNKKSEADKAVSDTTDSAKEAADSARGWFGNKKQEADKSVSDTFDSAKEAAENTRGWLSDKKQSADRAVSDTVDSAKNWAQSASDSAKETADNTRGWFWNKKQDADKAVSDTVGSAKDSLNNAAAESRDWARSKKDNAVDAVEHEWDWATGKADDMGRSTRNAVDSAADASKSWMWSQKSKADNAVANAADAVGDSAATARDRAANKAADFAGSAGGNGQGTKQQQQQRRDSLMSPLKDTTTTTGTSVGSDNSVLDALDSKFDDARTALRNTSEDLRTMASDASVVASDKLKDAVETVRFHPTNEGIVRERIVRGRGENGEDVAMRFVEIDSGIPQLSNSVREMSATTTRGR
ncbi:hypothetical protein GGI11_000192 [Coemansia sp. RSA 2049]|nr:hypothetical protein GGI11_000192 [Coemansia sp. RSA 2049]